MKFKKNKHTFYFNNHSQIFSLCLNFSLCHRKIFSLCLRIFPCVKAKFPVFSLSGKSKNQIPCFPCAVATLVLFSVQYLKTPYDTVFINFRLVNYLLLLLPFTELFEPVKQFGLLNGLLLFCQVILNLNAHI